MKKTNKKGISPLIATVLLIGFTIALAALVMTWGQTLFKQTTEQTKEIATSQIKCVQEVEIDIVDVQDDGIATLTVTVDNKGSAIIDDLIAKVYYSDDSIETIQGVAPNLGLEAYSRKKVSIIYILPAGETITILELLPITKTEEGEQIICSERSDKFRLG